MPFKWAYGLIGKDRWRLICGILLLSVAVVLMTVVEPRISAYVIDGIILTGIYDNLVPTLLTGLGVALCHFALRYFGNMLSEQASQAAVYNVRKSLFDKLMKQTAGFYAENRSGDIINKCTGDVEMLNHFLAWVTPKWIEMAVMLAAVLFMFISINPLYALILFAITPLSVMFSVLLGRKVRPAFGEAREQLSKLNTVVQENISGNRVVKAFVRENHEQTKFQKENQEFKSLNIKANMVWLKYGPMIDSVASIMMVINLSVGGIMVILEQITLGELVIFLNLAWMLNEPMIMLGFLINDTQRFLASAEKVMGLQNSIPAIQSPVRPLTPAARGEIELRNVSLSYGSMKALDNINLKIRAGETIGIMGPTGSGKTTLVSVIARFADVTDGAVLLDGVNVRDYDLQELRRRVAMTMQDVFLFSDTVESNIAYGVPDVPFEGVVEAAVIADADGFVSAMPEGYDTIVGERGTGLSGGQKQRVSLARALAKKAPVLVLDDTTSAVDMETEQYIQQKLRALPDKATTIIIAQRVSSVMHADTIVILDGGKIIEQGTHRELMAKQGYYYNTCVVQHGSLED